MTTPSYNDTNFRNQFPAFENDTIFPEAQLAMWWTMGTNYINELNGYPWNWNPSRLQLALDLMAAHLGQSFTLINQGISTVVVTGSTEGSVTVSTLPPPSPTSFGWWLATTSYGQQLRALLRVAANVGLYIGGNWERAGFRKAGGFF